MATKYKVIVIWLLLAVVYIPAAPELPGDGLDRSWLLGISYAIKNGLTFGREIVFTYGPLGAAYNPGPYPSIFAYSLIFWFFITLVLALFYTKWAVGNGRGALLCILPVMVLANTDAIVYVLLFVIGRVLLDPRHGLIYAIPLVIALAFLSLAKFTFFVVVVLLLIVYSIWHLLLGNLRTVVISMSAISLVVFFLWALLGQDVGDIPRFIINGTEISAGYSKAMGISGPKLELYAGVSLVAILVSAVICVARSYLSVNRAYSEILLIFLSSMLSIIIGFIAFKQGFVRQDGHVSAFLVFSATVIPMLISELRVRGRHGNTFAILFISTWIVLYLNFEKYHGNGGYLTIIDDNLSRIRGKLNQIKYGDIKFSFESSFSAMRTANPLPSINGTVDVASVDISPILAHGLDWKPRPVIQSYSSYTPRLASLNGRYVLESGPDVYFVKLAPIDGHLPLQEDPLLWPALLASYRLDELSSFMIYRRIPVAQETTKSKNVLERHGSEWLIPFYGNYGYSMLTVQTRTTILSSLGAALLRDEPIFIVAKLGDGTERKYKYIRSLDGVPFIISPLVENNLDFAYLSCLCGKDGKRVVSISFIDEGGREVEMDSAPTLTFVNYNERLGGYGEGANNVLGRSQYNVLKSTADGLTNPYLMHDGRLVANAHSDSEIKFYPTRHGFKLCYGVPGGVVSKADFDGIRFKAIYQGEYLVNDLITKNSLQDNKCVEINLPEKTGNELTLITESNGGNAYDWGYWYDD